MNIGQKTKRQNGLSRKKETNNKQINHVGDPTSVCVVVYLQKLRYELQQCVKRLKDKQVKMNRVKMYFPLARTSLQRGEFSRPVLSRRKSNHESSV